MLVAIDGSAEMYRALFKQGPPLTSRTGEPTRGTYFFTQQIMKLVRHFVPTCTHIVFALDSRRSDLERRKWFPEYKPRKSELDEASLIQLRRMEDVVRAFGICCIRAPGWEADDVLASLASIFDPLPVRIVGRDKDLAQLVSARVTLFDSIKWDVVDAAAVRTKFLVEPGRMVDYQALVGDTSDGIPGVRGVGESTALRLLDEHGSLDAVRKATHKLRPKLAEKIRVTDLDLMVRLVTLNAELDFDLEPTALEFHGLDLAGARPLFAELGFQRWANDRTGF